jgi:predicted RNA-binding protein with RPS1 domain
MLYMSTVDETSSEPTVVEDSAPETPLEVGAPKASAATEDVEAVVPAQVQAESIVEAAEPIAEDVKEATEMEIPAEVQAMDGVNGETEAHNAERPARRSLKKKPKGLPLTDFKVGDTIKGKAKSVAAYGAFMDIGAETDGLLHISNLSTDFVSSVKDMIDVGQEYDVRILSIDLTKKQVALSLLTEEQEESTAAARPPKREARAKSGDRNDSGGNANRRDDAALLKQLQEKGWDEDQFVSGTVVSTVDFGAFVRVDANQLNSEVNGEFDGLVHISALASGRVKSVTDVVKVGETVQVRCKGIDDRKVSLSMVSTADEAVAAEARGSSFDAGSQDQGNKDWKEAMLKLQEGVPAFVNKPVVVNSRKD